MIKIFFHKLLSLLDYQLDSSAISPLIYEALAEIMYPLPKSLSASILVQWINVVTLIYLFVAPNRDKLIKFLILIVLY